ncbi:MAG: glycosyltransferase family 39 protein [Paracoccaceae bacterium]
MRVTGFDIVAGRVFVPSGLHKVGQAMITGLTDPATINDQHDRRMLWRILALSMLVRGLLATFTPLGVDEAYAIAVAREFSWSFFDHPPLAFWSPVVAANLTGVEHQLVFRAPALLYGSITTWLIYAIGSELGGSRAGLWAALLHATTPAFLLAGLIILPDGPLGVGSAYCVLWLVRIAKSSEPVPMTNWVLMGAGLAVALASKYQAAFIPIATLSFMLISPVGRRWFRLPGPYVAALIGLIGLAPVLLWNVQNDWASFSFHGGRTGKGLHPENLTLMLVGQVLYLLPPVIVMAAVALWRGLRSDQAERLLLALIAFGPIIAFNIVYLLSAKSFPHWTMPGWIFALPLIGAMLSHASPMNLRRTRRYLIGFAAPVIVLLFVFSLHSVTGFLGRYSDSPPAWDQTADMFDYNPLYQQLMERGDLENIDLIAANTWISAGFMSGAMQGKWPVRVLSGPKHHFQFMTGHTKTGRALVLDPVLIAQGSENLEKMLKLALQIDPSAKALESVVLNRGSKPYITVNVIQLTIEN